MARSILLDRSMAFFKILEYDKDEWFNFWKNIYKRSFPRVIPLYEEKHDLSDDKIKDRLLSFNRSFLDRLKFKLECRMPEYKKRALKRINEESNLLKLSKSDFHMMIITLLGIEKATFIKTKRKGMVILIDPIALEFENSLDKFDIVILDAARTVRKMLDDGVSSS